MDRSHILDTHKLVEDKLVAYGFEKRAEAFVFEEQVLEGQFFLVYRLSSKNFTIQAVDSLNLETYVLFDIESANGRIVSSLRELAQERVDDIVANCLIPHGKKQELLDWARATYGVKPSHPFSRYADILALRGPRTQKMFALFIQVQENKLFGHKTHEVEIVNIKVKADCLASLIDKKRIFPAYHMNKKHWVSLLINHETDMEQVKELIAESFELVEKSRGR